MLAIKKNEVPFQNFVFWGRYLWFWVWQPNRTLATCPSKSCRNMVVKQTNTNFEAKNIIIKPNISHFLTPIELDFPSNVKICLSAKLTTKTIEFWYKSYCYWTCNNINVVRLASHNIPSRSKKVDMVNSQKHTNFEAKNIIIVAKLFYFLTPNVLHFPRNIYLFKIIYFIKLSSVNLLQKT